MLNTGSNMHRGSLQYWQKRRAKRRLPRARSYPNGVKESIPLSIVAYKVGMTHIGITDDSESPSKNMEISMPCTILEVPKMEVYGARFYNKDINGYKYVTFEVHHKELASKLKEKKLKNDEGKLSALKSELDKYDDITALMVAYPKGLSVEQHHPMRFESQLGGSKEEKFSFVSSRMGKPVGVFEVLKNGEYIDVSSVTKGKGWAGTIKRFGTARLFHKATQKVRHVGTLGPFTPGKVLFTVPQAGQLGFNYRTEQNKRIIKIGNQTDVQSITPKSGFMNYGKITNDYIMIKGSIGGPSKRLVRIRKSATRNRKGIKEPKIGYIATTE